MSKQDIEKRLGFAAQGVKAEFVADRMTTAGALRRAMRAKGVISAGDLEWYGILASDPDSAPYLYKAGALERMEDDRHQPNIFFPAPKKKASRPGVKAKFGRFSTEFGFLANQIKNQPDLAKKNIIVLAKKMGNESDITRAEFEQLMQYAAKLGMETQVANAHDDVRPGFSRTGAKGKFVSIVTTPQGRYTTNLDKNTRAPIEGGKGYVMVDPAQYITPKRVRVQGTKGEIEVRAVLDGKEIVGVSAKLVSARPGAKAKMGLEMNMLDFRHKFFTAFGTAIRDAKSNPNTAEAQSDEAVLRESWASMFAQGYSDAISDLNGLSATMKSKTSVGQMRKAASDAMEAYRQAKAAVRSSRPGVKAKA